MKKDIHPKYHEEATVTCACGNNFTVGSTKESIRVELCDMCHPFYTGKQKFVDTARRVEKFQEKLKKSQQVAEQRKGKKAKKTAAKKTTAKPKKKAKKTEKKESK